MVEAIYKYIFKKYLALKFVKLKFPVSPYKILAELHQSQYWPREKMKSYQFDKLRSLINSANRDVIYYRDRVKDYDLALLDLDDFSKSYPILSKRDVLDNSYLLRNNHVINKFRHSTSGSTGQPLTVEISGLAEAYRLAGKMRFYNWWGVDFHDKSVLIWKLKQVDKKGLPYTKNIKRVLKNRLDLDIFNLNDETVFDFVTKIDDFAPKYIRSYKSGLFELARLMDKHNLRFKSSSIKVAVVTSEVLIQEERDYIKNILGCKVANEYGSAEGGFYAGECQHGSMHINEELSFLSTDQENNTCVTELNNLGTPLINYFNGDKIVISEEFCSCGKTSRIIKEVEGRISDFILCQDGSRKSSLILSYIIRESMNTKYHGSIKQFRVVQNKNHFLLEMVPGLAYDKNVEEVIKNKMRCEIGKDIDIHVTEAICREASGKLRYFIRKS